jgi:hypothetical protein
MTAIDIYPHFSRRSILEFCTGCALFFIVGVAFWYLVFCAMEREKAFAEGVRAARCEREFIVGYCEGVRR